MTAENYLIRRSQSVATEAFALAISTQTTPSSSLMNIKRLLLAVVAGYVVIFATDWLIHEKWLAPDYAATQQVWRAKEDMASLGLWFLGAQIVTVLTFVLLWTRWASTARIGCAIGFGFLMGAFS